MKPHQVHILKNVTYLQWFMFCDLLSRKSYSGAKLSWS